MVWGAFSSIGVLPISFPSTKMNSQEYIQILECNLKPFVYENHDANWTFQQDNASIHNSRATQEWLRVHNIDVLQWPACSPDQNPIENLWGILVRKIYEHQRKYNSLVDLKRAVIEAWNGISGETLQNLIKSMPQRIFELIENKGMQTNY